MTKRKGWVKLYRQLLDSGIWGNPQLVVLWIWCLLKASSEKQKIIVNGEELLLRPGQFVTGRKSASDETGIPESTIYRHLKILENMNMLKRQANRRYTLITIVNWGKYQDVSTSKRTRSRTTDDTTDDTTGDTTDDTTDDTQTRIYKKSDKTALENRADFTQKKESNSDDDFDETYGGFVNPDGTFNWDVVGEDDEE